MKTSVVCWLLFIIGPCFCAKNVLFLVSDDMRVQLGAYDDGQFPANIRPTIKTTNLDALAAKSLLLKRAHVQYSVCGPSRTSLLTGRRPDTVQVHDIVTYWRNAGGNFTTIPQYFKENGYTSVGMGKIFHPGSASGNDDINYSWSEPFFHKRDPVWETDTESWRAVPDANLTTSKLKDMKLADEAVSKLEQLAPDYKNNNVPFFLAVGFHKPHLPFVFPESFLDYYPEADISLPDGDSKFVPDDFPTIAWNKCGTLRNYDDISALNWTTRQNELLPDDVAKDLRRAYYSSVSYIDSLVGQVLDKVDDLDLENDTIVVFWGDHGWMLGEHSEWCKTSNFELATQAPLMIHIPGVTDSGIQTDALAEFVDVFPTLVEAAGLTQLPLCPEDSSDITLCREGESLIPLINNSNPSSSEWKTAAFSQIKTSHRSGATVMGYSMRTDRYRYTEWVGFNDTTMAIDWTTVYGTELYDHYLDHYENYNLVNNGSYSSVITQLSQELHDGWREVLPAKRDTAAVVDTGAGASSGASSGMKESRGVLSEYMKFLLKKLEDLY